MRVHKDERRTAYCDLFPELPGDLNLFVVNPGQRTCWHRHWQQTDKFKLVSGKIMLGFFVDGIEGATPSYLDLTPMIGFTVAPGTWHGYENYGDEPAYLLMYLDKPYDVEDEQRMPETVTPWDPPRPVITWPPLVDDMWNKGQDPDPDNTA